MNKSTNTDKNLETKTGTDGLITLPADVQVPLLQSPLRLTQKLWRTLAGADTFKLRGDIAEDLGSYTMFALLDMIGFNRERLEGGETVLIPVAFESGKSVMRLTHHRQPSGAHTWTLSLPEERWPFNG